MECARLCRAPFVRAIFPLFLNDARGEKEKQRFVEERGCFNGITVVGSIEESTGVRTTSAILNVFEMKMNNKTCSTECAHLCCPMNILIYYRKKTLSVMYFYRHKGLLIPSSTTCIHFLFCFLASRKDNRPIFNTG